MRKSHTKQLLLTTFFGPIGILYVSVSTALALTLATLTAVLVANENSIFVLVTSSLIAAVVGSMFVRSHNRMTRLRDYSVSTYIGQVSCKITGKKPVKRNYSQRLAKVRRAKKIRAATVYALATLCVMVGALNTLPYVVNQFNNILTFAEPVASAATPPSLGKLKLNDTEVWQFTDTNDRNIAATLKADNYQTGSDGWYRPELALKCIDNTTQMEFSTEEVLGTRTVSLLLSFDNAEETRVYWPIGEDYRTAGTSHAVSLAKNIARAHSIKIAYTPFGTEVPKIAAFNLAQSSGVVNTIKQKCSW